MKLYQTRCKYPGCHRASRFFMCWNNKNGKHFGLVCSTHDKLLGRTNLMDVGMSVQEAIAFESYLKETVELESYPDWPAWLTQRGETCTPLTTPVRLTKTLPVTLLTLSPGAHNVLRRNGITTIEELANMSSFELFRIRMLGATRVAEIQKALREYR